ncbi:hypothetical protein [Nonomuraea sp. NPDC049141]|uniref:hypothetical protein n=1 Tax=Nonomuraea sp. NPDC049141 TaxID=3155500 RepID=UPI00340372EE
MGTLLANTIAFQPSFDVLLTSSQPRGEQIMASGQNDASVLLIRAEDAAGFAISSIKVGDPFNVVADYQVGSNVMQVVKDVTLMVSINNITQLKAVFKKDKTDPLTAVQKLTPYKSTITLAVPANWMADEGDILDIKATFKVVAGVLSDFSTAVAAPVVVET